MCQGPVLSHKVVISHTGVDLHLLSDKNGQIWLELFYTLIFDVAVDTYNLGSQSAMLF